ncbi:MAG TPA: AAA family ATPase, partial [Ilumatobacteraceae bacterium]|nr:AAA family ATPase [Ilumatobacteraceae bacterium]
MTNETNEMNETNAVTATSAAPRPSALDAIRAVQGEVDKVVVGQAGIISGVITALLVNGHVLLEGVPGVAKTLLAKSIAASFDMTFNRVQFTPDLMPADVIGQSIYEMRPGESAGFRFREGPVFTNLLLADEINRTPPKTQAALLEAMEERQVSIDGQTRKLPDPFLVIATQNPIEQEGTYPLPEAQLDRFMLSVKVSYPTEDEEVEIVERTTTGREVEVKPVLDRELLIQLQGLVRRLPTSKEVHRYCVRL